VKRRLLGALPLLVGALALGHAAAWPPALVLLAVIAAVSAVGPRWEVDTGRQFLASVVGAGAGYLLASFAYEPEPGWLGDGWAKLCCSALLAALARSLLIAPRGGSALTLALAFAALTFAGKARNPAYAGYVVAFLLSGVGALEESTRRLGQRDRDHGIVLAVRHEDRQRRVRRGLLPRERRRERQIGR